MVARNDTARENLALATHWLLSLLDPESGRVPNLGANDEVGDVGVLGLGEGGLRLFYIGVGEADGAAVLLCHFDDGAQRDLGRQGGRQKGRQEGDRPT